MGEVDPSKMIDIFSLLSIDTPPGTMIVTALSEIEILSVSTEVVSPSTTIEELL